MVVVIFAGGQDDLFSLRDHMLAMRSEADFLKATDETLKSCRWLTEVF